MLYLLENSSHFRQIYSTIYMRYGPTLDQIATGIYLDIQGGIIYELNICWPGLQRVWVR